MSTKTMSLKSERLVGKDLDNNGMVGHYRYDSHLRTYDCCECSYSSQTMAYLRQHLVCHSRERPFVCHYMNCRMDYKRSTELLRHINVFHLGIKKYKCSECLKSFTQSKSLKDHFNSIHLKLKPFVCDFKDCGKAFSVFRNMKDHQKRRHLCLKDTNNAENKTNCRTEQPIDKRLKTEFTFASDIINAQRNGSKSGVKHGFNSLKSKRKFSKNSNESNANSELFECNFIGCLYSTYVWDEIAQHFSEHWKQYIPFDY